MATLAPPVMAPMTNSGPPAALADQIRRRQFAEARVADCERQLADAHKTIEALTQLAASAPGHSEFGVIAKAALFETPPGEVR